MGSSSVTFETPHWLAENARVIQLDQPLGEENEKLLALYLKGIDSKQYFVSKNTLSLIPINGVKQFVSLSHDIIFFHDSFRTIDLIEMLEDQGDVIHYRSLRSLYWKEDKLFHFIPPLTLTHYFLNCHSVHPRSQAFMERLSLFLHEVDRKDLVFLGNQYRFSATRANGERYVLILNNGFVSIRPSKKNSNELRVEIVSSPGCLGAGTYGWVMNTPTHRIFGQTLAHAKHERVTKVFTRIRYPSGSFESDDVFTKRVMHEYQYAIKAGLSPKPPIFNVKSDSAYLTQKKVPGVTLSSWLCQQQGRKLGAELAYQASLACLRALRGQLHEKGVLHGDIKDNNMMIDVRNENQISVVFIDAGFMSDIQSPDKYTAPPEYTCPESHPRNKGQLNYVAFYSEKSDVYALAIVLTKIWGFKYNNTDDSKKMYFLGRLASRVQGVSKIQLACVRSIIASLLHVDPCKRMTLESAIEAFQSSYLANQAEVALAMPGVGSRRGPRK